MKRYILFVMVFLLMIYDADGQWSNSHRGFSPFGYGGYGGYGSNGAFQTGFQAGERLGILEGQLIDRILFGREKNNMSLSSLLYIGGGFGGGGAFNNGGYGGFQQGFRAGEQLGILEGELIDRILLG
jgi:hypothetical protein